MKKILLLILILFISATAFGQQPGSATREAAKKEITALLISSTAKDRAWAAYLIGKNEISEMVPELYRLAITTEPESDRDVRDVRLSALDSLIRLNAPLSTELAAKTYETFPNHTLILLAKKPAENRQFLLSLLEKGEESFRWVTICNLLIELKSPELVTRFLHDVTMIAKVELYDPSSNPNAGVAGGVVGGAIGHGIPVQSERGWPPRTIYQLTDHPGNGNVVVARGLHTIYYQTFVSKDGEPIGSGGPIGPRSQSEKDEYIIDYLDQLLIIGDVKETLRPRFTIKLGHGKTYAKELDHIRKEAAKSFRALVDKFADKELLTESPESFSIKDHLEIKLDDMRGNRKISLPKFPDVEIVNDRE